MNTLMNFLREGTKESSTRLVGVGCFVLGGLLAAFAVVSAVWFSKPITIETASVIAMVFINGGVALGIRKVTAEPEAQS